MFEQQNDRAIRNERRPSANCVERFYFATPRKVHLTLKSRFMRHCGDILRARIWHFNRLVNQNRTGSSMIPCITLAAKQTVQLFQSFFIFFFFLSKSTNLQLSQSRVLYCFYCTHTLWNLQLCNCCSCVRSSVTFVSRGSSRAARNAIALFVAGEHKSNWLRMATLESTVPHHRVHEHPYLLHSACRQFSSAKVLRGALCVGASAREERSGGPFMRHRLLTGQLADWPVLTILVNFHSSIRTCR